jgi:ATP adenylyltransferase
VTSEGPQDGVGDPDAFQRLWQPHRMAYIKGEGKPSTSDSGDGCPFCRIPGLPDDEGLIVARGTLVYAVLNLYPYNAGHLMVVPYRHIADYTELTTDEAAELTALTQQALRVLRSASGAQGFNMGFNLGAVAGAGIAAHLHEHIVPRWGGDTNMMPIVGHTRVLPQLLQDTRAMLAHAWRRA